MVPSVPSILCLKSLCLRYSLKAGLQVSIRCCVPSLIRLSSMLHSTCLAGRFRLFLICSVRYAVMDINDSLSHWKMWFFWKNWLKASPRFLHARWCCCALCLFLLGDFSLSIQGAMPWRISPSRVDLVLSCSPRDCLSWSWMIFISPGRSKPKVSTEMVVNQGMEDSLRIDGLLASSRFS